jgi:chaperonin GroES
MSELNAKAVNDKVIVKILEEENKTEGGIIVPEVAQGNLKPQELGEVTSVGELVKEIEVGDTIMFNKHGGMSIILDRNLCKVLKYDEVYGILKKAGE